MMVESSVNLSIRKYFDEKRIKQFDLVDGNLNWKDYDLIFQLKTNVKEL
jgi:hypothetical protein